MIRRLLCRFGFHRVLHVIQNYGAAKRVGCPDCRRTIAMHDGLQAALPWDNDFAEMYRSFGYDVDGAHRRWLSFLNAQ